jgi:hypothetical protein
MLFRGALPIGAQRVAVWTPTGHLHARLPIRRAFVPARQLWAGGVGHPVTKLSWRIERIRGGGTHSERLPELVSWKRKTLRYLWSQST